MLERRDITLALQLVLAAIHRLRDVDRQDQLDVDRRLRARITRQEHGERHTSEESRNGHGGFPLRLSKIRQCGRRHLLASGSTRPGGAECILWLLELRS